VRVYVGGYIISLVLATFLENRDTEREYSVTKMHNATLCT